MITALMLIALSGAPPAIDPNAICRNAQSAVTPEDGKAAIASCVRDEENARDKLKARWPHYSATARSACRQDGAGVPASYVEMWTCLEMQPGGSLSLTAANAGASSQLAPGSPPPPGAMSPNAPAGAPAGRVAPHAQPRPPVGQ